jgi:hypothetical protein
MLYAIYGLVDVLTGSAFNLSATCIYNMHTMESHLRRSKLSVKDLIENKQALVYPKQDRTLCCFSVAKTLRICLDRVYEKVRVL